MAVRDVEKIVHHLHLLIEECAPLREVGERSVDLSSDTTVIGHGPFDRHACALILQRWSREGWIGLQLDWWPNETTPVEAGVSEPDGSDVLTRDAVADVLGDPRKWTKDDWQGAATLFACPDAPHLDERWSGTAKEALGDASR